MGLLILYLALLVAALAAPPLLLLWLFHGELKSIRLNKKSFACERCGACCRFQVTLTQSDIQRLQDAGHQDFVTRKLGVKLLRKNSAGACVFMEDDNGKAKCRVYDSRPALCQRFPAVRFLGMPGHDHRCHGNK